MTQQARRGKSTQVVKPETLSRHRGYIAVRATTTAITMSGLILAMGAPVKWGFRVSQLAGL